MGFQWAGKDVIGYVHETYPDLRLMQTETECGNGSNDRAEMEHTFELLKHYFSNGANFYMYWNMVLESNGLSHWGWRQNSMISISEDDQVVYNPEFYLMKHFSYFIRPNARFIDLGTGENCLAFVKKLESQVDSQQHDLEEFKCLLQELEEELDDRIDAYDKDDY